MVDLLFERLKVDLGELRRSHKSYDDPEFQQELIVLIGANTREISRLVVDLYESRRQLALAKLQNTSCRVGPKMDQSISGGSRSRKDDTLSELTSNSRLARKNMARNGGFATERAWVDARLAYRRIVFRMIRSIERHCDDVICLAQNFLKLSPTQFETLCNQECVDMVILQSDAKIAAKQASLRRGLREDAHSSDFEDDQEYECNSDENGDIHTGAHSTRESEVNTNRQFNSAAASTETEERKEGDQFSYRSAYSSTNSVGPAALDRKQCVEILRAIIAIKRE